VASHKHRYMTREELGEYWKLHSLFRNPKVKRVLLACSVCHPKKKISVKKVGRILALGEDIR